MEEELRAHYEPLKRGPLRFQGVFGIARILYKRALPGILPLTLLLVTLPYGLILLLQGNDAQLVEGLNGLYMSRMQDFFSNFNGVMVTSALSSFLSLLNSFLIAPAYTGALYLELDQCVNGRRGTIRQLLRYALPAGFRQYYTTFLSQYAVLLCTGFVMVVIMLVLLVAALVPMILSSAGFMHGWLSGPFIWITALLAMIIEGIASVFMALVYPVAVKENKRAFQAVGRALHLAARRFLRILGVTTLYGLAVLLLLLLLVVTPVQAGRGQLGIGFIYYIYGVILLMQTLLTPFQAALNTALYIDAASREGIGKRKRKAKKEETPHKEDLFGKPIKQLFASRQEQDAPSDTPSKARPRWDGPQDET